MRWGLEILLPHLFFELLDLSLKSPDVFLSDANSRAPGIL
jgi:hypothetical protein